MSASATSAPARASVSASTRPSPRDAPVTRATRPPRSISRAIAERSQMQPACERLRSTVTASREQRARAFRALHGGAPFVIPNPWDAGSARALEALGFRALATTSSGFAFTLGRRDGSVTLDDVAAHVTALADATTLPISVDMENGYGREPEAAARAGERVAKSGAVGGSIEDWD